MTVLEVPQPADPVTPAVPETPGVPTEPAEPVTPAVPDEPVTPAVPHEPPATPALLVAEDRDRHVVRDRVDALGLLDDAAVVLDGARLGLDHALDDVDDVGLLLGRLQVRLLGLELHRAWDDAVELLD